MRLIDAEELLEHLEACLQNGRPLSNLSNLGEIVRYVKSMPTIAASPWHRVEELPKEDGKYLVYMFTSDWRWEFKFASYLHGRWIGAGGGDVCYWMPIEPPKEDA